MEIYSSIMSSLDEKDQKIIELLTINSKLTSHKISKKTSIPITTIHNRIKRLEKEGIIKKFSIELDKKKIGKHISAYILVTVNYPHEERKKFSQEDTARKIRAIDGVESVSIVTGETDIILKLSIESIEKLNELITKKLRNIDGVESTRTLVILNEF